MKTAILSLSLILASWTSLTAGIPVTDVAALTQRERHHQEVMLQQREQITVLERQLVELKHLNQTTGDPALVRSLPGLGVIKTPLRIGVVEDAAQPLAVSVTSALADDGRGLFTVLAAQFKTLDGESVSRREQMFKPEAAVVARREQFEAVVEAVSRRREQLREAARQALEQLRGASTDAEVQKLQGVLLGLHLELDATDRDLQFAAQRLQVQAIDNDNASKRQEKARQEEQTEEIRRSLKRLTEGLRPNTKPVHLHQSN